MKKNKEYIVLISIIIILLLILIFSPKHNKNIHYKLPKLPKINKTNISKIDIKKSNNNIELIKIKGKWFIARDKFPADNKKIEFILDDLSNLNILSLISTSKDYARYSLDNNNKIQVDVWSGDKKIFSFSIGKLGPNYSSTYIKLPSSPYIYMAKGNLRLTFDTNTEELRRKIVFSFNEKDIRSLFIKLNNHSITIKKNNNKWNTNIKSNLINSFINKINNLECESYITKKQNLTKNKNYIEIKVKQENTNKYIIIQKIKEKDGVKYIGRSNIVPYDFVLPSYKVEDIVNAIKQMF